MTIKQLLLQCHAFLLTLHIPNRCQIKRMSRLELWLHWCTLTAKTGFLGCVPVRSKGQYSLMVKELVSFPQLLGYTEVVYRADNEPTARQLLKLVVDTRLRMGLPTRSSTPPPYSHGNALAENCIARIRGLTGSLMFSLFEKLNMKFSTNSALWSWCMRHACWLLNRYAPLRGVTPYELVYGKSYAGSICQYGEPIFGFVRGPNKGDASWRRMIFSGKSGSTGQLCVLRW